MGYDIVGAILTDLALISDPYVRAKIHLQLLEYCDARRKTIETPGSEMGDQAAIPQVIFTVEGARQEDD